MLLVAHTPFIKRLTEINAVCQLGFENDLKCYLINNIANLDCKISIGNEKYKALPFSHAFSGCDIFRVFTTVAKPNFWTLE